MCSPAVTIEFIASQKFKNDCCLTVPENEQLSMNSNQCIRIYLNTRYNYLNKWLIRWTLRYTNPLWRQYSAGGMWPTAVPARSQKLSVKYLHTVPRAGYYLAWLRDQFMNGEGVMGRLDQGKDLAGSRGERRSK